MGPTCVGGCPWQIYASQDKLNNTCELVSCPCHSLFLVLTYDSENWWTISFNSLWNIDLTMFEPVLGYDWLQRKGQGCVMLESVFLASHGGARRSVPPFLYHTLRKICCTNMSQEYSNGEVWRQAPEKTCASAGKWEEPAKGDEGLEEEFLPDNQRTVGWRSSKLISFFDVFCQWLMHAYLSVTPYVPFFSNKEDVKGRKKKVLYWNPFGIWVQNVQHKLIDCNVLLIRMIFWSRWGLIQRCQWLKMCVVFNDWMLELAL